MVSVQPNSEVALQDRARAAEAQKKLSLYPVVSGDTTFF
jgi:hypothetical protein